MKFIGPIFPVFLVLVIANLINGSRSVGGVRELPWFGDVVAIDDIAPELAGDLQRITARFLHSGFVVPKSIAGSLTADKKSRILILSLSDGKQKASVFIGRGRGWADAWRRAMRQARPLLLGGFRLRWAKLDVVMSVRRRKVEGDRLSPGVDGLAFDRNSQIFLLPGQVQALELLNADGTVNDYSLERYLKEQIRDQGRYLPLDVHAGHIFTTRTWLVSPTEVGGIARDGQGGQVLLTSKEVDESNEQLVHQLFDLNRVAPVEVKSDQVDSPLSLDEFESELLVTLAALEAYDQSEKSELLRIATSHRDLLLRSLRLCHGDRSSRLCSDSAGAYTEIRQAYVVIALSTHMQSVGLRSMVPVLRQLAEASYSYHKSKGGANNSASRALSPAELQHLSVLIIAMIRAFEVDADPIWYKRAMELADQFSTQIEREEIILSGEKPLWMTWAISEVFRHSQDQRYRRLLGRILEATLASQVNTPSESENYGGFEPIFDAFYTASQLAALAVSGLAHPEGITPEQIISALTLGVKNLWQFRVQPNTAMYFANADSTIDRLQKSKSDSGISEKATATALIAFSYYKKFLSSLQSSPDDPANQ